MLGFVALMFPWLCNGDMVSCKTSPHVLTQLFGQQKRGGGGFWVLGPTEILLRTVSGTVIHSGESTTGTGRQHP